MSATRIMRTSKNRAKNHVQLYTVLHKFYIQESLNGMHSRLQLQLYYDLDWPILIIFSSRFLKSIIITLARFIIISQANLTSRVYRVGYMKQCRAVSCRAGSGGGGG